jgi:large conductance mechanosensitive channel
VPKKEKTLREKRIGKLKSFFNEFKTFAVKGNMLDMAVGMIVGGAFTALVTSIVTNIATPLIGILIGVDFSEWEVVMPRLYGNAEPGTLAIGKFLNSIISFVIVAFVVFLFVKAINAFNSKRAEEETPTPKPTTEEQLLTEIRDLLKEMRKDQ